MALVSGSSIVFDDGVSMPNRLAELGYDMQRGTLPPNIDSVNAFWPLIGQ